MAISLNVNPVKGLINHRIAKTLENDYISPADAILFGIAGALGALPEGDGTSIGPNAPMYEDEPSTWCNHCRAQYWGGRCKCGRV